MKTTPASSLPEVWAAGDTTTRLSKGKDRSRSEKPGRDAGRPRRSKKGLRRPLSLASQEAMRATAGAARPAVIDVLSAPVFWGGSRPSRGLNQRY